MIAPLIALLNDSDQLLLIDLATLLLLLCHVIIDEHPVFVLLNRHLLGCHLQTNSRHLCQTLTGWLVIALVSKDGLHSLIDGIQPLSY